MTELHKIPTIKTPLFATMRGVLSEVAESSGLAILRGPVGIGKSYALKHVCSELKAQGDKVCAITVGGALEGKVIEFCRAIHGRSGVTAAEGLDLAFTHLAGYPFQGFGGRALLVVDEAQELKSAVLALVRELWDKGDAARLGDHFMPSFGLVMVGNDQFLSGGSAKERSYLLPLLDRVTHDLRLAEPTAEDIAEFAAVLFPETLKDSAKLRDRAQAFAERRRNFRSMATAARQAQLRASRDGSEVTVCHLDRSIRMMGGI